MHFFEEWLVFFSGDVRVQAVVVSFADIFVVEKVPGGNNGFRWDSCTFTLQVGTNCLVVFPHYLLKVAEFFPRMPEAGGLTSLEVDLLWVELVFFYLGLVIESRGQFGVFVKCVHVLTQANEKLAWAGGCDC